MVQNTAISNTAKIVFSIRAILFSSLLLRSIEVFAAPDNIHYVMDGIVKTTVGLLALFAVFYIFRRCLKKDKNTCRKSERNKKDE